MAKSASGPFIDAALAMAKGSMELLNDVTPQIKDVLTYPVSTATH